MTMGLCKSHFWSQQICQNIPEEWFLTIRSWLYFEEWAFWCPLDVLDHKCPDPWTQAWQLEFMKVEIKKKHLEDTFETILCWFQTWLWQLCFEGWKDAQNKLQSDMETAEKEFNQLRSDPKGGEMLDAPKSKRTKIWIKIESQRWKVCSQLNQPNGNSSNHNKLEPE